jgi:hypothetical protein
LIPGHDSTAGMINLLFLIIPITIIIAYQTGKESAKCNLKINDFLKLRLTKKFIRVCSNHVLMLKVKQIGLLDNRNCDFCKKDKK